MTGNQDQMAQAYFLAQLEAAKGTCKCTTCRILRRANAQMTAQFLGPTQAQGAAPAGSDVAEVLNLSAEE